MPRAMLERYSKTSGPIKSHGSMLKLVSIRQMLHEVERKLLRAVRYCSMEKRDD